MQTGSTARDFVLLASITIHANQIRCWTREGESKLRPKMVDIDFEQERSSYIFGRFIV